MKKSYLSDDKRYLYWKYRDWDLSLPRLGIVTTWPGRYGADEDRGKMGLFVRRALYFGFGSLSVCHAFAFRAPTFQHMRLAIDPVGPENDSVILSRMSECDEVLLDLSGKADYRGRSSEIRRLFINNGSVLTEIYGAMNWANHYEWSRRCEQESSG